jgi:hypothetical protein
LAFDAPLATSINNLGDFNGTALSASSIVLLKKVIQIIKTKNITNKTAWMTIETH